ncbi:hypothetical protein GQ43DRAFT_431010 [Delitschia confertaspora ATCC 74209]|uniref:Uncharacterized protein n=1 Tax=Delitschia confertaspora ATCC 74209 TaxID=1513339 RepID=A0A9P4MQT1_9PLEO|nr:hypothetical protein GQ43DRAFT_431010 [Delitschia confertaspora ATCC 74209]
MQNNPQDPATAGYMDVTEILICKWRAGSRTRGSLTLPNTDQKSSPSSNTASHDSDHSDHDEDEDENGEEGTGEYNPYDSSDDQKLVETKYASTNERINSGRSQTNSGYLLI